MKFENKGLWMKEAEDKLASYDKQEHPDYVEGDDEICTLKTEDDELSGELLDEVEAEEMEKEVEDEQVTETWTDIYPILSDIGQDWELKQKKTNYSRDELKKATIAGLKAKGKSFNDRDLEVALDKWYHGGESAQSNEDAGDFEETYKDYKICYNAKDKLCYIQNKDGKEIEVVAKSSNYTKEALTKAAKAIIDRGNIDFSKKFVFESLQTNETKFKLNGIYPSADGQDKFRIDKIIGNNYEVTYDDGTKATLSEKDIEKWIAGESAQKNEANGATLLRGMKEFKKHMDTVHKNHPGYTKDRKEAIDIVIDLLHELYV